MLTLTFLVILSVLSTAFAGGRKPDAAAQRILASAVAAQGKLPAEGILSLHVTFKGQVNEKDKGSHSITREYWLRTSDRSFRILTYANIETTKRTERGVLGTKKPVYWELSRGRRMRLSGSNIEHIRNKQTIRRDRREFERILRIVLLTRIQKGHGDLRRASPAIVTIPNDEPNTSRVIFADRNAKYHALDLRRDGEDPLRLFLDKDSLQIKRVLQFDVNHPTKLANAYYLGLYEDRGGLSLPGYISVHTAIPTSKTRVDTTRLSGTLAVEINPGLTDADFGIPRDSKPVKSSSGAQKKDQNKNEKKTKK